MASEQSLAQEFARLALSYQPGDEREEKARQLFRAIANSLRPLMGEDTMAEELGLQMEALAERKAA
jgi:L-asparaginase II